MTTFDIATQHHIDGCRPMPKDHPAYGPCQHLKEVDGEVIMVAGQPALGIHKIGDDWSLTDIYSGCRIISTTTRKDARKLASIISKLYKGTCWLNKHAALAEIGMHMRAYRAGRWLTDERTKPCPMPRQEPSPVPVSWRAAGSLHQPPSQMLERLCIYLQERYGAIYCEAPAEMTIAKRALFVQLGEVIIYIPMPEYIDARDIVFARVLPTIAAIEGISQDDLKARIQEVTP